MSISWRKIRQEIQSHAGSYVLAVSGGVDSMFLLDFMSRCDVPLHVAHVDHMLRRDSHLERILVQETAEALQLPFSYIELPDLHKATGSIEAQARIARYGFLQDVRHKIGFERIVTAHHLNDQVETILLRLMRGHQHDELGMQKDRGLVYRPFLEVPKEEILQQAKLRNLKWIDDPSNVQLSYERNWVRHTILPEMMKRRNVMKTIPAGLAEPIPTIAAIRQQLSK